MRRNRIFLLCIALLAIFSIVLVGCDSASPTIESGKNDNPEMKTMRKEKKGD